MRLFLTFFAVSSAFIHRIGNVDLYNLLSLGEDEPTTAAGLWFYNENFVSIIPGTMFNFSQQM